MNGQVIGASSGKFSVKADREYSLSPRGRLAKEDILVGDYVVFDEKTGTIEKILPRKNFFLRPSIANVDAVNIVISSPPSPDYLMLDKLILSLRSENVEIIITVNKTDLTDEIYQKTKQYYFGTGWRVVPVSAADGEGTDELKSLLKGKLVAFAGQSAVGKTSLVNAMFGLKLETGDVSAKTRRGRHTTTATRIYEADGVRIADTPGFSAITPDLDPDEAALFYPEYFALLPDCKFRGCTHTKEPGCAVRKAVEENKLSKERYARYEIIYNELKNQKNNKY